MKMKQISDTTLKITMSLEDLMDRGMEIADFLVPQEKTEEFFYAILDELEMPDSFLDTGMLSFRVTPKPDKVDVFVTKSKIDQNLDFEDLSDLPDMEELAQMSPDEFIKTLEKSIADKTKDDIEAIQSLEQVEAKEEEQEQAEQEAESKKEPYIYYILSFAKLADLVAFAKTVTFEMETSELYKMNERYYLTILVDIENHPSPYLAWLLARMREFADDSDISRSVLQEYGQVLMSHDAVLNLQKIG
ncbi:adaptor protein [Streptococcus pneumoniae]|uniref:adaptor protein MecA n=1 Tax=Streptococcus pneumoniae TaxID=1313 RepID=UPI0005E98264|nr:adaptor protein MecA [Streptococcus pneumoniae]MDS5754252.1 adaptor protein MecA [Streptococcus pneumoniae]CIR87788.1 adaptor protein [Streptococcus pneumoniae]COD41185.1 adaptor protein [Streptococcus pneumoniae]